MTGSASFFFKKKSLISSTHRLTYHHVPDGMIQLRTILNLPNSSPKHSSTLVKMNLLMIRLAGQIGLTSPIKTVYPTSVYPPSKLS